MCAVFGFLDYKRIISNSILKRLIKNLAVAAEERGTDATGISYVRKGEIVTYKKPKPAHKVRLFFPEGTAAVTGHTRMTTQGSESRNCNNHPFLAGIAFTLIAESALAVTLVVKKVKEADSE